MQNLLKTFHKGPPKVRTQVLSKILFIQTQKHMQRYHFANILKEKRREFCAKFSRFVD